MTAFPVVKPFPDVIRAAMERSIFWYARDSYVGWFALVHGDRSIAAYTGTWGEILAINSEFITDGDDRRLMAIGSAPDFAPHQRKP